MDSVSAKRLRLAANFINEDWLDDVSIMGLGGFAGLRFGAKFAVAAKEVMNAVRADAGVKFRLPAEPLDIANPLPQAPLPIVVGDFLLSTEVFPDITTWMAYAAVVMAQEDFAMNFSATGSHEERLTGHLLSSLLSAVKRTLFYASECFSDKKFSDKVAFQAQRAEIQDAILFHYADIAMGKQEKDTGADLGVVLCVKIGGVPHFRPFRLQAKKVSSEGRADIRHPKKDAWGQARKLRDSRIGYYLYYFQRDPEKLSPLTVPSPIVQSVETILTTSEYPSNVDATEESVDLATFILRYLCRTQADEHDYKTVEGAIGALLANHEAPPSGVVAFGNINQAFRLDRRMEAAIENTLRDFPAPSESKYENDGPSHRPEPIPSKSLKR
ncbi:hypothetical protein LXM94_24140 [Rhizobium sp. TRM95111]|uniref:hypothetical protein n=1 Tax=Rhizobium alarense TaxID=2846851 RepID=UPI001F44BF23|nr:hypothetical protein [Rhizobium alarense]MCF3643056.1 hypothetical protein [Rhizobium alarense]